MSKELRVGVLIAIAGVVLVLAIFMVGDKEGVWKKKYELKVKYTDVLGLLPGAPVRLAGLRAGTVRDIRFSETEPGALEVILKIDNHVKEYIRADSKAFIGTLGLLGDKTIEITAGSPGQRVLEVDEFIPAGKSLSVESIISEGGEVMDDLKELSRRTKEIIEKINNGTGSLGLFVNDPNVYFNLDRLLRQTETLVKYFQSGEGSFARFVTDSTFYVQMRDLLSNTNNLFDSLSTGKGTLSQLMHDPAPYQDLKEIVSSWRQITNRIKAGEGTAGQLLTNDSLYINFVRTLDRTEALLKDFREHPGRYLKFRIF